MKEKKNRLIVVLGMHRSGTSAITRGLKVLGVSFGETLINAIEGVNDKGFWEDVDLNSLNVEMLKAIGSDWACVSAIDVMDIDALNKQGFFLRAVELLREKVSQSLVFAFKDPRVAKLLPFWKEVFSYAGFDVDYVLALRHPLSVAKSLAKRDRLEIEHGYILWLNYVLTSLSHSADKKRVIVDYDRLMQSPDRELNRLAQSLELEINLTELQRYKTEFLDEELRHTVYALNDLLIDSSCPPIVSEVYADLLEIASDNIDFEVIEGKIPLWLSELERFKSLNALIDKIFLQKSVENQTVVEREAQIVSLNQKLIAYDEELAQITSSRSWKLTKPFRAIRHIFKYLNKSS